MPGFPVRLTCSPGSWLRMLLEGMLACCSFKPLRQLRLMPQHWQMGIWIPRRCKRSALNET